MFRWLSKQTNCGDSLQEALQISNYIELKAIHLDYVATIRTMVRSELKRAANKRGNRFNNYLRNLGVVCGEASFQMASTVFQSDKYDV